MSTPVGYSRLISQYRLRALPLLQEAVLVPGLKTRALQQQGSKRIARFPLKYQPDDTLVGHLQFALRYEGINLQVLALLFAQAGAKGLLQWIASSPESRYARVACHLYEWLTELQLPVADPVPARARYVPLADPELQLVFPPGAKHARFRVQHNLPGTRDFCPLIHLTPTLQNLQARKLRQSAEEVLARYDQNQLRRVAAYLDLNEAQASYDIEHERPAPSRAQRYADALRLLDAHTLLSEQGLTALQHAMVDPRFHEQGWRSSQSWVGKDLGYRKQIEFVPARPEDVGSLMQGLLTLANDYQALCKAADNERPDAVLMAAAIAFGFGYIHPFEDGNGRLQRYLIHDVLAKAGFTPRGIVLPLSTVIQDKLDEYSAVLEQFSHLLNQLTAFDPDSPARPATGNDAVYFRYPDLTAQAEFLYTMLERSITQELEKEIGFLLHFERTSKALNELLDWPAHSRELFIRLLREQGGSLTAELRRKHFGWIRDEELAAATAVVNGATIVM